MAEVRHAQCHCGAVAFTVELTDGFNTARRCSCSFCRMRGAVAVSAPLSGITVTKGEVAPGRIAMLESELQELIGRAQSQCIPVDRKSVV